MSDSMDAALSVKIDRPDGREQRSVEIEAASRLHFGLLSFGQPEVRQFGGAGVMIDGPTLRLRVSPAKCFETSGAFADRVAEFVGRLRKSWNLQGPLACRIEVLSAPRPHVGFGTGTQLALAVAAVLAQWLGRDLLPTAALAASIGRGQRSAIGTWGFELGGLLVEGGHEPASATNAQAKTSPLVRRLDLPDAWRWVLLTPKDSPGLSGSPEREAFARLPAVPVELTAQLCDELWHELLPAAAAENFSRFSASLYRYGKTAGNCFAAIQGGPFANPQVAGLVERIRSHGIAGVGQSSWGPTVFALLPDAAAARDFVERLQRLLEAVDAEIVVAPTCNRGARVVSQNDQTQC